MKKNRKQSRRQTHKALGAAVGVAGAAMTSQACDAAIITVDTDGSTTGTATQLFDQGAGVDVTSFGGLLVDPISLYDNTINNQYFYALNTTFFDFYRSTAPVANPTNINGNSAYFFQGGAEVNNAAAGSGDNWLPGRFRVTGVNGGAPIFGWIQVTLSALGTQNHLFHTFTYDDAATDTTPFTLPIGGFSTSGGGGGGAAVPEPSGLALLAAGAAGVIAQRRRRKAAESDQSDQSA